MTLRGGIRVSEGGTGNDFGMAGQRDQYRCVARLSLRR